MKINISYKNIKSDEPLKVFVNDKIGSLDRFIKGEVATVNVEIGKPSGHHRKGNVFYAEGNLKVGGKLLRAQCQHVDLRSAIVEVKNKLQAEITKFKDRQKKDRRRLE